MAAEASAAAGPKAVPARLEKTWGDGSDGSDGWSVLWDQLLWVDGVLVWVLQLWLLVVVELWVVLLVVVEFSVVWLGVEALAPWPLVAALGVAGLVGEAPGQQLEGAGASQAGAA